MGRKTRRSERRADPPLSSKTKARFAALSASRSAVRLTRFSTYALSVLVHLCRHQGRLVTIHEISSAEGISHNHLMKVAQRLGAAGYIVAVRGRKGGLRLGTSPERIRLGDLVQATSGGDLGSPSDPKRGDLQVGLEGVLHDAAAAFHHSLNRHSVAHFARATTAQDLTTQSPRAIFEGPSAYPRPAIRLDLANGFPPTAEDRACGPSGQWIMAR